MGGVIATQAAALAPGSVDSLVFVAAFMPANGQSLLDLTEYPEGAGNQIKENMVVEGEPPVATLPSRRRGRRSTTAALTSSTRLRSSAAARRRSRRSRRR